MKHYKLIKSGKNLAEKVTLK
ncbi:MULTISPECIES: KxYKxGKxW signal peptide domain-containing protein [Emticicia]